jgi:hypothetical protein
MRRFLRRRRGLRVVGAALGDEPRRAGALVDFDTRESSFRLYHADRLP